MAGLKGRLNKSHLPVFGILFLILLAFFLLWFNKTNSMQALPPLVAQVILTESIELKTGSGSRLWQGSIFLQHRGT